jgi:hypothetical protein
MNFRIQSYLQFLWHSKNEHGVHSPFVFLLLTQGLYNKNIRLSADALSNSNKSVSKKQQLLYKIVRYGAKASEIEIIALGSPKAKFDNESTLFNCIFIHSDEFATLTTRKMEQLLKTTENDSFWILENIHSNRAAEAFWNNLKSNPKVTVTIDTFHFGLVFFRKEQVEEHFILRA